MYIMTLLMLIVSPLKLNVERICTVGRLVGGKREILVWCVSAC